MPIQLRKHTHEERLELANEISRRVLSRYGDLVVAVFISGSTAKNLDRPYSDLEMIVVHHDSVDIPVKYYLHKGIVVEILYLQESNFLKSARRITLNWPIEADQYRNRVALFERDGWSQKLDNAVSNLDDSGMTEALRNATIELVEDLSVLRNAQHTSDAIGVRATGLYLAGDAAKVVLLLNQRYVLTTSWFWKQAFECPVRPGGFQRLIERTAGFVPASLDEIAASAEELCDAVFEMIRN